MKINENKKIILLALYFPLNILMIETLAHLSFLDGFFLLFKTPFSFLLNTIFFCVLTIFLLAILRKDKLVFSIMTILSIIIGIGTKLKIDFRGVGLNILDFSILKEAGTMTNNLTTPFIIKALIFIVFFLILFAIIIRNLPSIALNTKATKNGILTFVIIIFFLYFIGPYTVTVNSAGIKRKLYIEEIGSLYYFAAQIQNTTNIEVPDEEEVTENLKPLLEGYEENIDEVKPDIIIIQSESFSDPTVIGMEQFSTDPLPYFHKLQEEGNGFNISVPSFCGGTANTEYEIITGLSTMFYPTDATVFANYMSKPTISVGSILRNDGYESTLIHPFHSSFYSRNVAYKLLGFNTFYGLEYLENQPTVENDIRYWDSIKSYMSDSLLNEFIIDELEKEGPENKFIFTSTMQNHTPFRTPEGYEDSVTYLGNGIADEDTLAKYNKYLCNLRATDDAIKELITYLENREKPTILLFYGDHYPKINQDGNAYAEIGLVEDFKTAESDYITHEVPGLIWSNYKDVGKTEQTVDASLISSKFLDIAGVRIPNYMKINKLLADKNVNSMTNAYLVMNNEFFLPDTEEYEEIYQIYSNLNGDIIGDKNYLEDEIWYIEDNSIFTNPQGQEEVE